MAERAEATDIVSLGYPKRERLCRRPDIDRVFKTGARYSCRGMRLHAVPNSLQYTRVVFVTLHSYPGAVQRNHAKRLLRECWRIRRNSLRGGFDVAIVLFPGYDEIRTRDAQLDRLLLQAGIEEEKP